MCAKHRPTKDQPEQSFTENLISRGLITEALQHSLDMLVFNPPAPDKEELDKLVQAFMEKPYVIINRDDKAIRITPKAFRGSVNRE